jgi:hypothetical protein
MRIHDMGRGTAAAIGSVLLLSASGCGSADETAQGLSEERRAVLASSDVVEQAKTPDSPWRIIYHAPPDLARD